MTSRKRVPPPELCPHCDQLAANCICRRPSSDTKLEPVDPGGDCKRSSSGAKLMPPEFGANLEPLPSNWRLSNPPKVIMAYAPGQKVKVDQIECRIKTVHLGEGGQVSYTVVWTTSTSRNEATVANFEVEPLTTDYVGIGFRP